MSGKEEEKLPDYTPRVQTPKVYYKTFKIDTWLVSKLLNHLTEKNPTSDIGIISMQVYDFSSYVHIKSSTKLIHDKHLMHIDTNYQFSGWG